MSKYYAISHQDLSAIISRALDKIELPDYKTDQELHKKLSQDWVKQLALEIERHYTKKDTNIISFYNQRSIRDSKIKFKEFLFDITVAETQQIEHIKLSFISNPIWQIESEFKQTLTAIIEDFQKLISGAAPYKMMVGPLNTRSRNGSENKYLVITKDLASYVAGTLYFLLIPHPRTWFNKGRKRTKYAGMWHLYEWNGKDWGKISL